MNLQGQLCSFLVDNALIARVLLVGGGRGGRGGGGGSRGPGGEGGDVLELPTQYLAAGAYSVTIGNGSAGTVGGSGGRGAASSNGGTTTMAGVGSAAGGDSETTITVPANGTASDITGASVTYGADGIRGETENNDNGATTVGQPPGRGGNGGGGDEVEGSGGDGSAARNGAAYVWYPGPQRATGGTITTVGNGTLHAFTTNGTLTVTE